MARQMMDIGLVPVMAAGVQVGEDCAVVAGDFTVVESTQIHKWELIQNNKGDFKQNPTICVGVLDYTDDEGINDLVAAITDQFVLDGMDVKSIAMNAGGGINPVAYYK